MSSHRFLQILVTLIFVSGCAATPPQIPVVDDVKAESPKRVLFVGNSYLYYGDSLHNHVRMLARTADPSLKRKLNFKSATISGARLDHHNIDHLTMPGALGVKDPFQWVVLQGFSAAALSEKGSERFWNTALAFDKVIKARGGKTALYMPHAYVKPNKRAKAENIRLNEDLYVSVGKEIGALVIPVGLAFEEAYRRRPEIILHKGDGSHPEFIGTYLAACTVYASLYGKSPVGNEYDYFGRVDKETAVFLQQVAEGTVKAFYGR